MNYDVGYNRISLGQSQPQTQFIYMDVWQFVFESLQKLLLCNNLFSITASLYLRFLVLEINGICGRV